jgi:hypothetical protein
VPQLETPLHSSIAKDCTTAASHAACHPLHTVNNDSAAATTRGSYEQMADQPKPPARPRRPPGFRAHGHVRDVNYLIDTFVIKVRAGQRSIRRPAADPAHAGPAADPARWRGHPGGHPAAPSSGLPGCDWPATSRAQVHEGTELCLREFKAHWKDLGFSFIHQVRQVQAPAAPQLPLQAPASLAKAASRHPRTQAHGAPGHHPPRLPPPPFAGLLHASHQPRLCAAALHSRPRPAGQPQPGQHRASAVSGRGGGGGRGPWRCGRAAAGRSRCGG